MMRECVGDMWEGEADAIVVTTNGTIKANGDNVMGGGCALEAATKFPELPTMVGRALQISGNMVFHFWLKGTHIVTMPVKHDIRKDAEIDLIKKSAKELVDHADGWKWKIVAMPRPGCGLGGLKWKDVKPELENILDDRFLVYDYK